MSRIESRASSLGRSLRDRRREAGLSQADVARAAGIGRSTLIHLEQASKDVRLGNLLAVAEAVGSAVGVQAESPDLAERRLLRLEEALKLARRREAHLRFAADLALGRREALQALEEARGMVGLWKRDRTCSEFYIAGWSKVLAGDHAQVAGAISDMDQRWLDAMLQNTPLARIVADT